ncbi:MAG: ADP-glyceromanno-heptose 6-epimerase [Verrucomicrobiae bacterium]|nr:ADP-glyceromanno-heptose 6-epimerase [Verrucomicrobiae bacterium]
MSKASGKFRNLLVTGGAGFIGSNLALTLQEHFPNAWVVVVDDFRSGSFENLRDFRGDVIAADLSRLDLERKLGKERFDAIFHLASITDTTQHDQRLQTHDNVEGFRNLLEFAAPRRFPIVYASSAATYGQSAGINREDQSPRPANVYAFSKMILDNLARRWAKAKPGFRAIGLKYFNVYGPREKHKAAAASMIYQLYLQMKAGKRPRVFKFGEQRRDFVYVKDVVNQTIAAAEAPKSGIYNAGSGFARSFNDIIAILNRELRTKYSPDYFDNPYSFYQEHTEADMSRAKRELKFVPHFTLELGIADYVRELESK